MDIVSRLKQFLDSRQITVTQFADACVIPRPSVSQMLNGRNRKVSDEVIAKIHYAYPDLSMMWLMFGEGTMNVAETSQGARSGDSSTVVSNAPARPYGNNPGAQGAGGKGAKTRGAKKTDASFQKGQDKEAPDSFAKSSARNPLPWERTEFPRPYHKEKETVEFATSRDDEGVGVLELTAQAGSAVVETTSQQNAAEQPMRSPAGVLADTEGMTLAIPAGKGRRVVTIIVYYDDNSYEPFIPDTSKRNPFMPQ